MGKMSDEYIDALNRASIREGANTTTPNIGYAGEMAQYVPGAVAMAMSNAFNAYSLQSREVPGLFVLCAEPGMDTDEAVDFAVNSALSTTVKVCSLDLRGNSRDALSKFANFSRDAVKYSSVKKVFAACKGLPPADESELQREVTAIRRMREAGCFVVLSILPEASQLVEELPDAICYKTRDFLMDLPKRLKRGKSMLAQMRAATHGVPVLVRTVSKLKKRDLGSLMSDPGYCENFSKLVRETVRDTLMDEEKEARCALLLLGEGDLNDLKGVLRRCDDDILASIARNALICGLKMSDASFECVGTNTFEGLSAAYESLSPVAKEFPSMAAAVVEKLVQRGEWRRAAIVCSMCPEGMVQTLLPIDHAASFIDAGEVTVVADAIERSSRYGLGTDSRTVDARRAIELMRPGRQEVENPFDGTTGKGTAHSTNWVDYLAAIRALCRGVGVGTPVPPAESDDDLTVALSHFAESLRLVFLGDFSNAFGQALKARVRLADASDSLLEALLSDLYCLSSGLSGAMPTKSELAWHDASTRVLESWKPMMLYSLHKSVPAVIGILMGHDVDNGNVEAVAGQLERNGETMLKALAQLTVVVSDLRRGSRTRANVRAGQVLDALERAGKPSPYLEEACRVLLVLLGDADDSAMADGLRKCKRGVKDIDCLCDLLADSIGAGGEAGVTPQAKCFRIPPNAMWIANLLLNDFGRISERFSGVMPSAWRRELQQAGLAATSVAGESAVGSEGTAEGILEPLDEFDLGEDEDEYDEERGVLRISVLGKLSVSVSGESVPVSAFERRRAKELLALLAAMPQHQVKRYKIMESVWPDTDYVAGQQRVYEATSVLRSALAGKVGKGADGPLLSNRTERTLSLNPKCVVVDVDRFERMAYRALDSEGNDRVVVAAARKAEMLYRGDLFVPANDGVGLMEQRRKSLRHLYTDVMIAGSLAALRSDRVLTATRFAQNAYDADNTREDAIKLLVASLVAAGRASEAEKEYKIYCCHMVDTTRRPPSRTLRDTISRLMSGGRPSAIGIMEPETEVSRRKKPRGTRPAGRPLSEAGESDEGASPSEGGVAEDDEKEKLNRDGDDRDADIAG